MIGTRDGRVDTGFNGVHEVGDAIFAGVGILHAFDGTLGEVGCWGGGELAGGVEVGVIDGFDAGGVRY